jgi:D-alanine transaminase
MISQTNFSNKYGPNRMSRIAYVNGRYVPLDEAAVHIEDRGYQFADGVYEVIAIKGGHLVDEEPHLKRLVRSLGELKIRAPMSDAAMKVAMRELIRRNRVRNGSIYMQLTRGVAPRDFAFPANAVSSLVMTVRRMRTLPANAADDGVRAITIPDIRWNRCDIKTVGLTAAVLGKQRAREAGAYEAWQVDRDGYVTEGTSSNAWILTEDGKIVTRPATNAILSGITRRSVLELAKANKLEFEERPFTVAEAKAAREAWITSATSFVLPVTQIDDRVLGNGKAGSFTLKLRALYMSYAEGEGATA